MYIRVASHFCAVENDVPLTIVCRVVVLSARPCTCLESHMALYAEAHFRSVPTVGFADFFIRAVIARK